MDAPPILLGLLPVLLFLAALLFMDSYKLVSRGATLRALGAGVLAAVVSLLVNRAAIDLLGVEPFAVRRYFAPPVEEFLKALYLVHLVRRDRVGFLVDAGILGFAIGSGFALVENTYYAQVLGTSNPWVWVVRGLGTAIMHGSTTAIIGVSAKFLAERGGSAALHRFLPGLVLATALHSAFNHLMWNPLAATSLMLLITPLALLAVYDRSERATRDWLGIRLDQEADLLAVIEGGDFPETRAGSYLESLRTHLPGRVVADMLCLLQIHLELSLRAKGIMIARAANVELPTDPEITARFAEMDYLRRSIGPTGQLAIMPLMRTSSRDLWQIHMLQH